MDGFSTAGAINPSYTPSHVAALRLRDDGRRREPATREAMLMNRMSLCLMLTALCLGACLAADSAKGGDPRAAGVASAPADWLIPMEEASPAFRYGHAMAYDSARGRVVLFGGEDPYKSYGDT